MTTRNLKLAKPNKLVAVIIILISMVTWLLMSTSHMTWMTTLPELVMVIGAMAPMVGIVLGVFLYFYK